MTLIPMPLLHDPLPTRRIHLHVRWRILILCTTISHSLRYHALVAKRRLLVPGVTLVDRLLRACVGRFSDETALVEHLGYLFHPWHVHGGVPLDWATTHMLYLSLVWSWRRDPRSHRVGDFLLVFLIFLYRI